jgi:hypothetical protein
MCYVFSIYRVCQKSARLRVVTVCRVLIDRFYMNVGRNAHRYEVMISAIKFLGGGKKRALCETLSWMYTFVPSTLAIASLQHLAKII